MTRGYHRRERFRALVFSFLMFCALIAAPRVSALTSVETGTIRAYEKVAPSVVNITTRQCDPEYFWCAVPTQSGSGSGVVLGSDGLIITNNHVVSSAQKIMVALSDGRRLEARLIAASSSEDFAVLRVDPGDKPLSAIQLGDSNNLKTGERVLAVGNPFGLGQTLTAGTVSMTGRTIKDGDKVLKDLIQTDAPINPGNSGGALVNMEGELVGICTAILSPTGSSIRIGFALPVNRMKAVVSGLVQQWPKFVGWAMAILILVWFLRRVYRPRPGAGF